jgi:hypothetical protein
MRFIRLVTTASRWAPGASFSTNRATSSRFDRDRLGSPWCDALIALPLRQERARVRDGDGASQPAGAMIWQDDRGGPGDHGEAGRDLRVSELRAVAVGRDRRSAAAADFVSGRRACGGMPANTMAAAIEALGMSLPCSSPPAESEKAPGCRDAGLLMHRVLEADLKPRDIMTREAFENAMVLVTALGVDQRRASPDCLARSVSLGLTLDVSARGGAADAGRFQTERRVRHGGPAQRRRHAAVMKMLLSGTLDGGCVTSQARPCGNLEPLELTAGRSIVRPLSNPIKATAASRSSRAISPRTVRSKITGKEGVVFGSCACDSRRCCTASSEGNPEG